MAANRDQPHKSYVDMLQVPWQRFTMRQQVDEWVKQFIISDTSGDEAPDYSHSIGAAPSSPQAVHENKEACPHTVRYLFCHRFAASSIHTMHACMCHG
jgi:hypothetical protein